MAAVYLLTIISLLTLSSINAEQARDFKKAILSQRDEINKTKASAKAPLMQELAVLYLKDQDQEHAFETFINSLKYIEIQKPENISSEQEQKYKQALALYFASHGDTPQLSAKKLLKEFGNEIKEELISPLNYLIAISQANLGLYEEFFHSFSRVYSFFPDHFLAYKTKAILYIKLMERNRDEALRQRQREAILYNLQEALKRESQDTTLYKLLITFSLPETRQKQARYYLNKIMENNTIILRSDILFYVHEAVDANDFVLAQQFIDKAHEWYQSSRLLEAAQSYLDEHKKLGNYSPSS